MTTDTFVTIIGAGPAGLLLARYLQLHQVQCVVYERDASLQGKGQGHSFGLDAKRGVNALRKAEAWEVVEPVSLPSKMSIRDSTGKVYWHTDNEAERQRSRVNRRDLMEKLAQLLIPGTIRWGHGVSHCQALSNSRYLVSFSDPSIKPITTSILVGADGVWSRVRPLLTSIRPKYEQTAYLLGISEADMTADLKQWVGDEMSFLMEPGKAFIIGLNHSGRGEISLDVSVDYASKHPLPPNGAREALAEMFKDFKDPRYRTALMAADEETVVTTAYWALDPDYEWETDLTGVTMIADAAHVMSPWSGSGANEGLTDAHELGKTLVRQLQPGTAHSDDLDHVALNVALRKFESEMMDRVRPVMRMAEKNNRIAHEKNAAQKLADEMLGRKVELSGVENGREGPSFGGRLRVEPQGEL